jgi:hypothetical protein
MPSRRERLLAVLAEHPAGLAGETLLTQAGPPFERGLLLRTLRKVAAAGEVRISGRSTPNGLTSVLVELSTGGCRPQSSRSQKPPPVRDQNSNSGEDFGNTSGDLP